MDATPQVLLTLEDAYRFRVDFGLPGVPPLTTDATPPLGRAEGPDSELLLVAAVANCLSASLLFALRKFRNDDVAIRTSARGTLMRNEQGRLRVQGIEVDLHLSQPAASLRLLDRALAQYEDFCVVTQSVRTAIAVAVRVHDAADALLSP